MLLSLQSQQEKYPRLHISWIGYAFSWNASTSKVTKLCDLGNRDGVCSVQWT
ncbi:hypothetical protein KFK09_028383 [Dendrobium nobile]|uniref:Uncharacterized protein n=1 Tax=Dendrobium nobile TaxID=94219 RepID=A0A8T3A2Z1_DENNO|nr:hypothetical protein KFK09_028383 [Dendrobium nobile]